MNLKTRLERLETVSPSPVATEQREYSRDELLAMPVPDLVRLHRETLNAPTQPVTREEKRRQEETRAHLATLPPEEIQRLHREALGDLAETKRRW